MPCCADRDELVHGDQAEITAQSCTVTWPANCVPLATMTPSPMWQSCARCTYDMMKLSRPTFVTPERAGPAVDRREFADPRAVADLDPVSSSRYLRSCGGPPTMLPVPTNTRSPRRTLRSSVARAAIRQPRPTLTSGPMIRKGTDLDVIGNHRGRVHGGRCRGCAASPIHHPGRHFGLTGNLSVHERLASHLARDTAELQHLHLEAELVAGEHALAEADPVDRHEVQPPWFPVLRCCP